MPQTIEHIDAIARQKGRGVLFLEFHQDNPIMYDYENDALRQKVLENLSAKNISWFPCAGIAADTPMCGYSGEIYIDVPYDTENALYQKLEAFLEHPDGTMKFPTVGFWYLSLELAMKNAHHDEDGYWEDKLDEL